MGSFLSLLMATIGLWVLILMASDGLQMQGPPSFGMIPEL